MDRNSGSRDQPGDPPASSYYAPSPSQFPQSQYPVPTDSELNMSSNYSLPASYAQQLHEAASSKQSPSPTQPEYPAIPTNGASHVIPTDPAMAPPPQTPNSQSFSAPVPHSSIDESADLTQTPQTGDKRKRSKVSRACDECRRKKVRMITSTQSRLATSDTDLGRFVVMLPLIVTALREHAQIAKRLAFSVALRGSP